MSRFVVTVAAVALSSAITQAALSADMGIPMKTSAPIAAPNDWTGLYVGGFVGAGWGTDSATLNSAAIAPGVPLNLPLAQVSNSGFIGGGQIGYNYQQGWVVWGIEGDFAGTNIKGSAPCLVIFSCTASDNWLATASARVGGLIADRALVYVKGGGAWLNEKGTLSNTLPIPGITSTSATSTAAGWLLGMGTEYKFDARWSGVIEYDYMDFGTNNTNFVSPIVGLAGTSNVGQTNKLSVMKIGLNYKFF